MSTEERRLLKFYRPYPGILTAINHELFYSSRPADDEDADNEDDFYEVGNAAGDGEGRDAGGGREGGKGKRRETRGRRCSR